MKLTHLVAVFLVLLPAVVFAAPDEDLTAIQDNSFLLEEAYNQEYGVVQHISVFDRDAGTGRWIYSFTQEWPAPSLRHQLSYSLPVTGGDGTRAGQVALNYRYQLIGSGETATAIAPRISLLLPTGDADRGGMQLNLPLSRIYGSRVVGHTNAGVTLLEGGEAIVNAGQSFIYAVNGRFHAMLEAVYYGSREGVDELLISPGFRFAINRPGGLQIVPGAAGVLGFGPGDASHSVLLYLSIEHPFRREPSSVKE